ncbi:uncharacterized protein MELLADRAFT_93366 [Melampsora larici-populina 98AG31]|uniref:EMC1 first beta-propeller domain-containing protein n=1 Tax=Melampsora larici-populina (strain 98AG31 / pathotype 3-4-7) TaxID=747676 RepID=F4RA48_MELLP|nr:uncharacterized protein MELLADRAFT_93366 [Melampsora larici-populina 98AG31]EGG10845.1 hypothetical protein MELLADRAFT_93366 [Melampsora larici-populina 98AG31]
MRLSVMCIGCSLVARLGLDRLKFTSNLNIENDPTWHLPLIGRPTLKSTQTSPSLSFLRHSNPTVRLSGSLPSIILTTTQNNLLAALNPRNGSIIWRLVLPTKEPILRHAVNLDHKLIGLVSGDKATTTIRLLTLNQGRVLWERHIQKAGDEKTGSSDNSSHNLVDLIFSTDQHSPEASKPDLIVACWGQKVLRLKGKSGEVRWTWSSDSPNSSVARLLVYPSSIPQIESLSFKNLPDGTYETHISTLSSLEGHLQSTRTQSKFQCRKTPEGPLLLNIPSTSLHAIVCVNPDGKLSSVQIGPVQQSESDSSKALKLSSYSEPDQNDAPILQDIGLAHHGIFLARFGNGHATVLRMTEDGSLKSAWQFADEVSDAAFAGAIDRDGLPYVSRTFYAKSLALGNFEIVALTPTEFTPDGITTGLTFNHDQVENGKISQIVVEVLETKNYVPYSRSLMVTELGTIQLWQGAELKWERHEDLSEVGAIVPYQASKGDISLLGVTPSNLLQYALQAVKESLADFLDMKIVRSNSVSKTNSERVWFIGTSTGRLFAIKDGADQIGKILWKKTILGSGSESVQWKKLGVVHHELEGSKFVLDTALSCDGEESLAVKARVDLLEGRALFKYHNPNLVVELNEESGSRTIEVSDQHTGSLVWSFEMESGVDTSSILGSLTENWLVLAAQDDSMDGMTRLYSIEWYMSSKADIRVDG